jgi:hypothetical protein
MYILPAMKATSTILLLQLALSFWAPLVGSLPSGAPSCEIGAAAPKDPHTARIRNPVTGPISTDGYQVFIDGVEVPLNGIGEFAAGTDHVLTIKSSTGLEFKGALVLVSSPGKNLNAAITPTLPEFQSAPVCGSEFTGGVTHVDRTLKKEFVANLRVNQGLSPLYLDVNIVPQNNVTGSTYWYSRYELKVTGGAARIPKFRTCGLLGLSVFCPLSRCGWPGRILWLCKG